MGRVENGDAEPPAAEMQQDDATTTSAPAHAHAPALQVIILGSGGGPLESNTTAFLVRALATGWQRSSMVAVDAGVHLAAISNILQQTQPQNMAQLKMPHILDSGPFAGIEVHTASPAANAAHIARSLVDTYLITHPHLDHIAGFVVNTAGLPGGPRPKRLAGLPATIEAFKNHMFNNVIWPNLSDENDGAGLVTYTRLVDGGSPAVGEGDARGYLEIAEGIAVKACSISHGRPIESPPHRNSQSSTSGTPVRYSSFDASSMAAAPVHVQQQQLHHHFSQRSFHHPTATLPPTPGPRASFPIQQHSQHSQLPPASYNDHAHTASVYDSTAYFLRDVATGSEVLIFGDVEPDALSSCPRNLGIWQEAAPKIARRSLRALLIECSYDDGQASDRMFGHLKPSFIIDELRTLAGEVDVARASIELDARTAKKRKRGNSEAVSGLSRRRTGGSTGDPVSPKTVRSRLDEPPPGIETPHLATPTAELSLRDLDTPLDGELPTFAFDTRPLEGLKVVIVHVKDKLDGVDPGAKILGELLAHEEEARLGVEFIVSAPGQSIIV
ncbi:hypothetical protein VD0001_g6272 [Verticillium dahliae]|nr:hypothetical protein VD0001_g6272 [Verticillium dahliae]